MDVGEGLPPFFLSVRKILQHRSYLLFFLVVVILVLRYEAVEGSQCFLQIFMILHIRALIIPHCQLVTRFRIRRAG